MKKIFLAVGIALSLFLTSSCSSVIMNNDDMNMIEQSLDAVVEITSYSIDKKNQEEQAISSGSGFFIAENLIVTNHHVIEAVANDNKNAFFATIQVRDSEKEYDIDVLASDELADIALVQVKDWDKFKSEVPSWSKLEIADSVSLAETVFAIGKPWGYDYNVTKGIVTNNVMAQWTPADFIFTDTSLFHGNSGGPLINRNGQVVGVSSIILNNPSGDMSDNTTMSGAVSFRTLEKVIEELLTYKSVAWPVIGIKLSKNHKNDNYYTVMGYDDAKYIQDSGIIINDRIKSINGIEINEFEKMRRILFTTIKNTPITVTVLRVINGEDKEFSYTFVPNTMTTEEWIKANS